MSLSKTNVLRTNATSGDQFLTFLDGASRMVQGVAVVDGLGDHITQFAPDIFPKGSSVTPTATGTLAMGENSLAGTAEPLQLTSAKELKINMSSALPPGSNNIGKVDVRGSLSGSSVPLEAHQEDNNGYGLDVHNIGLELTEEFAFLLNTSPAPITATPAAGFHLRLYSHWAANNSGGSKLAALRWGSAGADFGFLAVLNGATTIIAEGGGQGFIKGPSATALYARLLSGTAPANSFALVVQTVVAAD